MTTGGFMVALGIVLISGLLAFLAIAALVELVASWL